MTHALADHVTMIAEFSIKPDMREKFLDYTVENLKSSRTFPGNIAFDILVDESRPQTVLFYEVWETAEAQRAYLAWRARDNGFATLFSYLDGPPKFNAFRRVEA